MHLYEPNSSPPILTKLATGILQGQSKIAEPGKTTGLGAFYILIKIHKPVIAGRPIVASYDSISYFASKYLDAVLQPFRKLLPSFLESSATLLPRLPTGPLPPGYSLMTADIVSLYPSIPHEFGLKATNFMLRKLCHVMCPLPVTRRLQETNTLSEFPTRTNLFLISKIAF
jgi:hypothetical protein